MFRNHFKLIIVAFSLGTIILIGFAIALTTTTVQAQNELLWLNPANASAFPGTSTNITLQLDSISNVYGAQIHVTFDSSIVSVTDANPSTPTVIEISPGSCPQPNFVPANQADNSTGDIDYAVTQLNPTPPCSGGDMAMIEFQCLIGDATSPITITTSIISDPDGVPIPHSTQNGSVECLSNVFSVEGNVALQSWPDPSGTVVTLRDSQGAVVGAPVVVGPDGNFSLIAPISETYQVEATYDRYLSVEATGLTGSVGEIVDIGSATLPTGDINGDGAINILDITALAGNFNEAAPITWGD